MIKYNRSIENNDGMSARSVSRRRVLCSLALLAVSGIGLRGEHQDDPVSDTNAVVSPVESNSNDTDGGAENHVDVVSGVSTTTVASQETTDRQNHALEYITSPQRALLLQSVLDETGKRVVELSETGEKGKFHLYCDTDNISEPQTTEVADRWCRLRHSSQFGGSSSTVSADVYIGPDGKPDLSRGVAGVYIMDDNGFIYQLMSPNQPELVGSSAKSKVSHTVRISSLSMPADEEKISNDEAALTRGIEGLKGTDQRAIEGLMKFATV